MLTFTAIDFETANPDPWSICQVGLVRVEDGIIHVAHNGSSFDFRVLEKTL
ncbi:MAG TPA: hypothetical protein VIK10_03225 [Prolixibacteraceae bacterium]